MKRKATVIKEINKAFPPDYPEWPVAFEVDGRARVSGETSSKGLRVVDYYGEHRGGAGGPAWVHPKIEGIIDRAGYWYEWENPGGIVLYPQ